MVDNYNPDAFTGFSIEDNPEASQDSAAYFSQLAQESKNNLAQNARRSLIAASDSNPDQVARAAQLSRKYNVPQKAIEQDLDFYEKEEKFNDEYFTKLSYANPDLASFIANQDNAGMIHDDVGNLLYTADKMRSFGGALAQFASDNIGGAGEQGTAVGQFIMQDIGGDPIAQAKNDLLGLALRLGGSVLNFSSEEGLDKAAEFIRPPEERRDFVDNVTEGLGQVSAQILIFARNPAASVFSLSATGAEQQADRLDAENINDPRTRALAQTAGGLVTAATERVQLGILFNKVPGLNKIMGKAPQALQNKWASIPLDIGTAAGAEAAQEVIEGALQDLIAYAMYNPDQEFFETLKEEAATAGVVGGIARTAILAATGGRRASDFQAQADQAKLLRQMAEEAKKAGTETNLAKRDPEKFKEFLSTANEGAEVTLDPSVVDELFQSDIDMEFFYNAIPEARQAFEEAELTGADINLPADKLIFAMSQDETNGLDFLADFVKLGDGVSTKQATDIDFINDQIEDVMRQAREEQASFENEQQQQEFYERIEQQVTDNLMDINRLGEKARTPDAARQEAALYGAFAKTVIERGGEQARKTLENVFGGNFAIKGPQQAPPRLPITGEDTYIDALRTTQIAKAKKSQAKPNKAKDLLGKVTPKREKATPKPLISAIVSKGKIARGSEAEKALAGAGVTPKAYPRLFAKDGKVTELDNIVADELESTLGASGIFARDEDLNGYVDRDQLIDLIREETDGNYIKTDDELGKAEQEEINDQVINELERRGLDITTATNDQVKQALADAAAEYESGDPLYQDERRLVVRHNLSVENLMNAEKLGGLPVPSLAIGRYTDEFDGFGEITLIADPSLIDPKASRQNRVFGADVYSPRYPSVTREVDDKEYNKIIKTLPIDKIKKLDISGIDRIYNDIEDRGLDDLFRNDALQAAYLIEQGTLPKIPYAEKKQTVVTRYAELQKYSGQDHFDLAKNEDGQFYKEITEIMRKEGELRGDPEMWFDDGKPSFNLVMAYAKEAAAYNPDAPAQVDRYELRKRIDKKIEGDVNYEQWIVNKFNNVVKKEKIFDGYTPSGNRRYLPHNLESVVKVLKRELRDGEGMNYGLPSVRSKVAKEFKSIQDIKNNEDLLVSDAEFQKVKEETDKVFMALGEKLRPYSPMKNEFGFLDAYSEHLKEIGEGRSIPSVMSEYYDDVPDNIQAEIAEFMDKLRSMPTEYFEAKLQRAVGLNEFESAVMPAGKKYDEAAQLLQRKGLQVTRYDKDKPGSKLAAIKANRRLFFQSQQTVLNTQSEAFKNWFGDSKVVDENGEPLTVYHGTEADISIFNTNGSGKASGTGAFFTENPDQAATYATGLDPTMYPVKLSIKKPAIIDYEGSNWNALDIRNAVIELPNGSQESLMDYFDFDEGELISTDDIARLVRQKANDWGVDGLKFENLVDRGGAGRFVNEASRKPSNVYVAFDPSQIKSVNNRGTFDPNDDRILYQSQQNQTPPVKINGGDVDKTVTGQPVTFNFVHNTDSATKHFGVPKNKDAPYGRYYEPSGRFMTLIDRPKDNVPDGMIQGTMTFRNPIVVKNDSLNWKKTLSKQYGGKRGKELSKAIIANGHDGIITLEEKYISEIVDLTTFDESIALYQDKDTKRGSIQLGAQGERVINLFEGADESTFFHETGHLFLDLFSQIATDPNATDEIKADFAQALKFMGVNNASEIGTEQHEKWARGFEAYLYEGKAPSQELTGAFDRFKMWLLSVYKNILQLDVKLDDNIRGVFDRLLATDTEIEALKNNNLFKADQQTMEMLNESERTKYMKQKDRAITDAKNKLFRKALRQKRRENTKWYNEQRELIKADEEKLLQSSNLYRALQIVTTGKDFQGQVIFKGPTKFSEQDITELYGNKEILKYLPRGSRIKGDGIDIKMLAEMYGFTNAKDMIDTMINADPYKLRLQKNIDEEMIRRHGDMLNDGSIEREALAAVMQESTSLDMIELQAISRQTGQEYPTDGDFQIAAKRAITQQKVDHAIKPDKYYRASLKAAVQYGKALRANRFETTETTAKNGKVTKTLGAADWKRRVILNKYMYKEAIAARTEVEKALKQFQKLSKTPPKKKKPKIDPEYHAKIWDALGAYQLGPRLTDGKRLKLELSAINQWIQQQKQDEFAQLMMPQEILDADEKTHYRDLTLSEFRGLKELIQNIETQGRRKLQYIEEGKKRNLAELIDELSATAAQNNTARKKPISKRELEKTSSKIGQFVGAIDAVNSKAQILFAKLDGGEFGVWQRTFFEPVQRAEVQKNIRSRAEMKNMQELIDRHYGKKYRRKKLRSRVNKAGDLVDIESFVQTFMDEEFKVTNGDIDENMTREMILSIALHQGTADNKAKLLDGYAKTRGWDQAIIDNALSNMTASDWAFVQDTWDYLDSFWPEVSAIDEAEFGYAAEKIQHEPLTVTTADGETIELRGGYMRIMYDRNQDVQAEKEAIADVTQQMMIGAHAKAQTRNGSTIERANNVERPIRLDLDVLSEHIGEQVQYITMREAIANANKVLRKQDIQEALQSYLGNDGRLMIETWLQDTASSGIMAGGIISRGLRTLRTNYTLGRLGLRPMTALLQFSGLAQTAGDVGTGNMLRGLVKVFSQGNPYAMSAEIKAKSPYMKEREFTLTRDVADAMKALTKADGGNFNKAAIMMLLPMQKMQEVVDSVTWAANYQKALKEGFDDADAIRVADIAVSRTQGSGLVSDLAAIERGTLNEQIQRQETVKFFTMFFSYFNAKYNVLKNKNIQYKNQQIGLDELAVSYMMTLMLEGLISAFLMGQLDFDRDDDDEIGVAEVATTIGLLTLQQTAATLPIGRDIAGAVDGFTTQGAAQAQLQNVGTFLGTTASAINKAWSGEADDINGYAVSRGAINAVNAVLPIPAGAMNQVLRGAEAESKGDEPSIVDYLVYRED